jgi:hypothetical protein
MIIAGFWVSLSTNTSFEEDNVNISTRLLLFHSRSFYHHIWLRILLSVVFSIYNSGNHHSKYPNNKNTRSQNDSAITPTLFSLLRLLLFYVLVLIGVSSAGGKSSAVRCYEAVIFFTPAIGLVAVCLGCLILELKQQLYYLFLCIVCSVY